MSRIWRTTTLVLTLLVASCTSPTHRADPPPTPSPSSTPTSSATPQPLRVELPASGTYEWALAPLKAGSPIEGSANASHTRTSIESVIKVWLVADILRWRDEVSELDLASHAEMIGRSDDWLAQRAYELLGTDDTIYRMVDRCKLRRTVAVSGWWARTLISAADLVRLGQCISDGRAAGERWTPWLLQAMTTPKEAGAFGIVDGLASDTALAYMNGWTDYGDVWRVNCLAIGPAWVLAVITQYQRFRGLHHGAGVCAGVAKQLVAAGRI